MTHLERARELKRQNASENPMEERLLRFQQVVAVVALVVAAAVLIARP
jgi:hypothetical protein